MSAPQGVLGVYSYVDAVIDAIKNLKSSGYSKLRVFSPVPNHEIEHVLDEGESPVRFFTLFGGLFGAICGLAFTVLTSLDWPLYVSAKPIVSLPPYMVIVFEMTILFGALSTLVGLLINSLVRNRAPVSLYDPRFSDDKFGVMVICEKDELDNVRDILKASGAEEVKVDTVN